MAPIDFDKYYKIDRSDGSFTLHFLNKERLGEPEIREIFAPYGEVVGVNYVNKDHSGLVFVRYRILEEVIRCLIGLKGSNIELLPERSKLNKKEDTDSSQQQAARTGNSSRKTFHNDKKMNSNSIRDKNLPNIRENSPRTRSYNENNGPDNLSSTNYQNSMHKPNPNVMRGSESDSSVFNEKSSFSKQISTETVSDTTIDYEKYYREAKDDTYSVHFINRTKLEYEEIKELFSRYGDVAVIYAGGKTNELRFVRYKTREDVIRCIKGLQNNNAISLLPQKDKVIAETKTTGQRNSSPWQAANTEMSETKPTDKRNLNPWQATSTEMDEMRPSDQRSSYPWQAARTEDTSQRTFSTGQQFNSNSIHNERSPENREKPVYNTKTSDSDKMKDTGYSSDNAARNSRQGYKFNKNKIRSKNTSPRKSNEQHSFSRQQNSNMNNEDYERNQVMREKQQETKLYPSTKTETDIKMDRNMRVSTPGHKMPSLIFDTETKLSESDARSDSLSTGATRNSSEIVVVPVEEIIVANIHKNYGVHYILHLFEKYGPISATLVKTIPEKDLRYCHVYFRTVQDAVVVEKEFDHFDLSGKNLIVLQKSRLMGETICK